MAIKPEDEESSDNGSLEKKASVILQRKDQLPSTFQAL
jgi:hypothetical protein